MTGSIRTVVVVGGGITASSTAAALKRRIPSLDITMIMTKPAPAALADRMISTLPSIQGFHRDIGLTDEDTIQRAGSGLRMGTLFEGWAERSPAYVHAYGSYGAPIGGVAFHQLYLREGRAGFDRFSAAAQLARAGQVADAAEHGLQLNLPRYGEMMRAYAQHLEVSERRGEIAEVGLRADGFIEAVTLEDGSKHTADLFVDCTGPDALLRSKAGGQLEDWSQWLPCDRITLSEGPAVPDAIALDDASATADGWRWSASSTASSLSGHAYSSVHASIDEAGESIELRQGRWRDLFARNCVAIGDAAVSVEPLEWTNLHLAHSQIDRLISMMPGRDCAPVELGEFNRQCGQEADRIRDFLCLHYVCSDRSEPFWKDASRISPPPSLSHTLSLFRERGRLPYYEEETFTRDSWLAVLLGQGIRPRRVDPMTDLVPREQAERAMASIAQSAQSFDVTQPALAPLDLNPRGAR
jgi:tryptophan halogenase